MQLFAQRFPWGKVWVRTAVTSLTGESELVIVWFFSSE